MRGRVRACFTSLCLMQDRPYGTQGERCLLAGQTHGRRALISDTEIPGAVPHRHGGHRTGITDSGSASPALHDIRLSYYRNSGREHATGRRTRDQRRNYAWRFRAGGGRGRRQRGVPALRRSPPPPRPEFPCRADLSR
jgi:hypothetical protein